MKLSVSVVVCFALFAGNLFAQQGLGPMEAPPATPVESLAYDAAFFPGAVYDEDISTPEELLGYRVGDRAATHAEIEACMQAWDAASDRTKLVEYARSYEDRPLYYMVVSSAANLRRLDEIKENLGDMADPRRGGGRGAGRLVNSTPAVAWLAYSIHGDETSGADAALAVTYHLAAAQDDEVVRMLDELVVIIDPMMNPDGRDRFLKQVREHRSVGPNVDDQSLLHTGYWPWGRTNHYLFDLNRDWILGVHPETRGRIAAVNEWRPLLFVDSHEMGSQDTYLFSPSREPVNPNLPKRRLHWWDVFSKDQAAAFDAHGWRYYTGEWNEEWYPGYSSSWAGFRGAVGILYEQAGIAEDGVRRPEGTILTYRESVHHQVESSMANLGTLLEHHEEMLREFIDERREAVSSDGPFAGKVYAVVPNGNESRMDRFVHLMLLEGFEVHQATRSFRGSGVDRLGRKVEDHEFSAKTVLISARQPEAALIAAMLEFDPRMRASFLEKERREILRTGNSKLYDTTAWNLTMMHDVDGYMLDMELPGEAELVQERGRIGGAENALNSVAFVIGGMDDRSVSAAARLMERGVEVRVSKKKFNFDGQEYARGSIVVAHDDNRLFKGDLGEVVDEVCAELGVKAVGVASGLGPGVEVPDLGGEHFVLLERPRIAIAGRGQTSSYSFGAAWHALDHRVGVRTSQINIESLSRTDLRRYNVLVVPSMFGSLEDSAREELATWVEQGGTLVALGGAATALANEESGLSAVRRLRDVLESLDEYEIAVLREVAGRVAEVDEESVWGQGVPEELEHPWAEAPERESLEELKRRDAWRLLFSPQGAFVAGRVDDRSWLTAGLGEYVPVLYAGGTALMAKTPVEAPVRLGVFEPADEEAAANDEGVDDEKPASARAGWAITPAGMTMRLRMSGLLWPEAAQRLANAAYITRERRGAGQVILIAGDPVFRGSTLGTGRLFLNAVIYGPGMGAQETISPVKRE